MDNRRAHFWQPVDNLRMGMVLLSLEEMGVFKALINGGLSLEDLAFHVEAVPSRLQAFLDMAVFGNYLDHDGERYALVEGDKALFDGSEHFRLGIRPTQEIFQDLGRGVSILKGGDHIEVAGSGSTEADQASRERFLLSIHKSSIEVAERVAALLGTDARKIIDLGCGAGTYSFALLDCCPHSHAVLVDRENAWPLVQGLAEERGHLDRVDFIARDFLTESLPEEFDLAMLSNVIHIFSAEDNIQILRNVFNSLVPGGRVVIKDYCMEPDRSGSAWALDFALQMAMFTKGGGVYDFEQVQSWCVMVGLEPLQSHEFTEDGFYLVIAQKPVTSSDY